MEISASYPEIISQTFRPTMRNEHKKILTDVCKVAKTIKLTLKVFDILETEATIETWVIYTPLFSYKQLSFKEIWGVQNSFI